MNKKLKCFKRDLIIRLKVISTLMMLFLIQFTVTAGPGDTSWMTKGKYGIFMHYQYRILLGYCSAREPMFPILSQMTASQWNQFVDGFDVKGFAKQMARAKVGWVMFCLDDHRFAWPCSPNSKFNYYTGYGPGQKCSNRDLIMDVANALNAKGIKLIVYYAGLNGYNLEPNVLAGLKDTVSGGARAPQLSAESRKRRLEILKEYADRFGTKIAGWWFDGMGLDNYNGVTNDWNAINSIVHNANPKAVIAFSWGDNRFACVKSGIEDYTGGDIWTGKKLQTQTKQDFEQSLHNLTPENIPPPNGILWHGKIFCGNIYHGVGDINQFSDQELIDWINICNRQDGVCTLDWPFDPNTGLIKDFGMKQMIKIGNAVK